MTPSTARSGSFNSSRCSGLSSYRSYGGSATVASTCMLAASPTPVPDEQATCGVQRTPWASAMAAIAAASVMPPTPAASGCTMSKARFSNTGTNS